MRIVSVVSAKGGVGKTTVCASLAVALARFGIPVLGVDLDPQNALRLHLGLPPHQVEGIAPATLAGQDWRAGCLASPGGPFVLPYGQVPEAGRRGFEAHLAEVPLALREGLARLQLSEDAVAIVDTPPGASIYLQQALAAADLALIVSLADAASYATLPTMHGLIETYCAHRPHFRDFAYVLNQVDYARPLARDVAETMRKDLGPRLVALLHDDQAIAEALAYQRTSIDHAPSARGTQDLIGLATFLASAFGLAARGRT